MTNFNKDIKYHLSKIDMYNKANSIVEKISMKAGVDTKDMYWSCYENDNAIKSWEAPIYCAELSVRLDNSEKSRMLANIIKEMVVSNWKKETNGSSRTLTASLDNQGDNISWTIELRKWLGDSQCEVVYKTTEEKAIPLKDNDEYELKTIDGEECIVRKKSVLDKVVCPDGYNVTTDFFGKKETSDE